MKTENEPQYSASKGEILAISQFTLSWRGDKGNRPSFDRSMPPAESEELFQTFCTKLGQCSYPNWNIWRLDGSQSHQSRPVTFIFEF